jgi:hypothetical protein
VLTGEAAVTLGATNQGMVAGDLVNTASRLQSVAQPGTVLVGEATQRAASGRSPSSPPASSAQGQAGAGRRPGAPCGSWPSVGGRNRARRSRPRSSAATTSSACSRTCSTPRPREAARLVSVIGPAGIGKTRLAWEFLKYIDGLVETVWWHDGRSPAYGEGISFWALGEMVRAAAACARPTTRRRPGQGSARRWRQHVPDPGERRWIEPALLALLGIEPAPIGSEQLFAAWRTFFERLAATAPRSCWSSRTSTTPTPGLLDFVDHLLEWSRTSRSTS